MDERKNENETNWINQRKSHSMSIVRNIWFLIGFLFITARRYQLCLFCVKFKWSVVNGSCGIIFPPWQREMKTKNKPFQFRIYNQYNWGSKSIAKIRSHTWHILLWTSWYRYCGYYCEFITAVWALLRNVTKAESHLYVCMCDDLSTISAKPKS